VESSCIADPPQQPRFAVGSQNAFMPEHSLILSGDGMREIEVTDAEYDVALTAAKLKRDFVKVREELDASPCRYRGCELFAWCETCNGWHDGCTARRPEALYK